jgi:hypothetical protein
MSIKETLIGLAETERKDFYYHIGMNEKLYNYYVDKCEADVSDNEFAKVAKYEAVTINTELPQLVGTEKQVSWAEDIRRKQLTNVVENICNKISEMTVETKDQLMAEANVSTISEFVNMMFLMQTTDILTETSAKKIIETR